MAPNRGERSRSSNLSSKNSKSPLKPIGGSKSKIAKSHAKKAPPSKQLKTRPGAGVARKKRKIYTEAELGLPKLNMITPVGVQKPSGKKKGKVFVDDAESMMTILALVNADREGQIESKMMKARHMEEIREARKAEAEKREEMRKDKLELTKDGLRKKRMRKGREVKDDIDDDSAKTLKVAKSQKRVSFR